MSSKSGVVSRCLRFAKKLLPGYGKNDRSVKRRDHRVWQTVDQTVRFILGISKDMSGIFPPLESASAGLLKILEVKRVCVRIYNSLSIYVDPNLPLLGRK